VGGHTAAKTGANYYEVEIESVLLAADVGRACGAGFSIP
jgi:hypothetical protein